MNNSWPVRRNKWEILKYAKPICSCEHTVIIRAVIVHRVIYLRKYFSFRANHGNSTDSLLLVKYEILRRLYKLCLSELQEPIKQKIKSLQRLWRKFSGVLQSGQRCFGITVACITTSEQSGFAELQMWRGLGAEAARHFPLALRRSSDDTSESMVERRSRGGEEEDACQNNVPPGRII